MALSCASALAFFCRPWFGWSVASVLPVWFSFRGAAGLLSFAAAVRCLWLVAVFVWLFCLCVWGACGLARSFLVSPTPLWLVLCAFWSSQCSAGPSLRVSGCICNGPVVIASIWRVAADWLPVFTPPHGNKGFGPVWGFALSTMLWVLFRCLSNLH